MVQKNIDLDFSPAHITSQELFERTRRPEKNDLFIDVRTTEEYEKEHIPHFQNYPLGSLMDHLEIFEGKNLILSCKTGARAYEAGKILQKSGLKKIQIIEHSESLQGWKQSGLQTVIHHEKERDGHPALQVKKPFENFHLPSAEEILTYPAFAKIQHSTQELERDFIALAPQRQLYVLMGLFLFIALVFDAFGKILVLSLSVALLFSGMSGRMVLNRWIEKVWWNRKK